MTNDALAELREQFRENTRTRIADMRELIERLRSRPSDSAALSKLHRHFHGLAGLGSTYGHPAITAAGDEGEGLCDAGRISTAVLDRLQELSSLIERDATPAE